MLLLSLTDLLWVVKKAIVHCYYSLFKICFFYLYKGGCPIWKNQNSFYIYVFPLVLPFYRWRHIIPPINGISIITPLISGTFSKRGFLFQQPFNRKLDILHWIIFEIGTLASGVEHWINMVLPAGSLLIIAPGLNWVPNNL